MVKSVVKNNNDSIIQLDKYSLTELLKLYSDNLKGIKKVFSKKTITGAIVARHEIDSDLYAKYRDDFWNQNTTYIHTLDTDELKELLKNSLPTDYVLFTFTKEKKATDFKMKIVNNHEFNSFYSCFPSVLLKQMIDDVAYQKITVGKGLKYIDKPPYNLSKGNYNIAMLKYFDKKGNVQYFDIVEDPSVSAKK